MTSKILDMSAGNRGIWFDKNRPEVVFLDIRPEVDPSHVCDVRAIPDAVGSGFDLVVFDPPHANFGANGNMSKCYGHHTAEAIRELVKGASKEAHRVAAPNALMAFKWNDHDQKLSVILDLMATWWEPLFGHKVATRTRRLQSTQWVMLRRRC